MGLRNTILSTGLMGLLGLQEVSADEQKDTAYGDLTLEEVTKQLEDKALQLNDSNFKKEVLDYDGPVIILFDSTCPKEEKWANVSINMQKVYLSLIDKFDDAKVNNLDLKFAFFDGCKFNGNNSQTYIGLKVTTIETHMYLDGKEIDRRRGGPIGTDGIQPATRNMTYWINYNLLGITELGEEDRVLLYRGEQNWKEFPRSVLEK